MYTSSNLIGFILAVVSGAFIGSSFIIKKKGLQRAGLNGTPASKSTHLITYPLLPLSMLPLLFPFQVSEAMVIFFNLFGGSAWLLVST